MTRNPLCCFTVADSGSCTKASVAAACPHAVPARHLLQVAAASWVMQETFHVRCWCRVDQTGCHAGPRSAPDTSARVLATDVGPGARVSTSMLGSLLWVSRLGRVVVVLDRLRMEVVGSLWVGQAALRREGLIGCVDLLRLMLMLMLMLRHSWK